jgi:hypothetical protein
MRLERSEVRDVLREPGAGDQVLGGIAIPLRPGSGEREVDHRAEHQRRGQRMTL